MAYRRPGKAQPDLGQRRDARGQRGPGVFEWRGSAYRQQAVVLGDALEFADRADVDQQRQLAQLLVDPQADVGRAGQQPRLRLRGVGGGQRLDAARRKPALGRAAGRVACAVVQRRVGSQRAQRGGQRRAGQPARRQREHALAGVEDRPVAGAAAEVAGQRVGELLARRPRAVRAVLLVAGGQRDRKARGAEAALRTVAFEQRLLRRVQRAVGGEVLDAQQGLAVEHRQESQAGVDAAQAQLFARPGQPGQQHGAGAAVALVAAFLGAGAARMLAQPSQRRGRRWQALDLDDGTAVDEADRAGRHAHGRLGKYPEVTPPSPCGHTTMRIPFIRPAVWPTAPRSTRSTSTSSASSTR